VSTDAGTTWTVRNVTAARRRRRLHPRSLDRHRQRQHRLLLLRQRPRPPARRGQQGSGATWTNDADIGASLGIENAVFVEAVAGDSDRAACGFVGTRTAGNHEDANFKGTWYVVVAHTYTAARPGRP